MAPSSLESALVDGDGFHVVEGVVPSALVGALRDQVLDAARSEAEVLADIDPSAAGRVLELAPYGGAFLDLLELDRLFAPVEEILGADATLQTYPSSCLPPLGSNSSAVAHVDQRTDVPGFLVSVGIFVLLDDFTPDTGATEFLPGSHRSAVEPTDIDFERAGRLVSAPAGSACYFNPRTWHRATVNRSDQWRCCVIPAMTRPWARQRFDLPAMVPDELLEGRPPSVRRRLGFDASSPRSYEEYYERRHSGAHRHS